MASPSDSRPATWRHEASPASLAGLSPTAERFNLDVPMVEDVFNNARGPTDAFSRSLAANGRRVASVDADPGGTITINTTPKA